ncbi:hypothetical protein B0H10DRAFT_2066831 [Mycena sp. CBHHK59/15]|nr:hypothetical protein B0H10DRAFT_2066831 [Mycena sp. CBHHK59/15]
MSVCETQVQIQTLPLARKRTTSFSIPPAFAPNPRPRKAPRVALHRTESVVDLTAYFATSSSASAFSASSFTATPSQPQPQAASSVSAAQHPDPAAGVPYQRTLRYYKEQKERRKAQIHHPPPEPAPVRTPPAQRTTTSSSSAKPPRATAPPAPRASPLAPPTHQRAHPLSQSSPCSASYAGPSCTSPSSSPYVPACASPSPSPSDAPPQRAHPRARPAPDLHRAALTACMRASPAGAKILHMGPRLALGIMMATRELERIVREHPECGLGASPSPCDGDDKGAEDVPMPDAPGPIGLSTSWVVVPPEDWEMVDCGA